MLKDKNPTNKISYEVAQKAFDIAKPVAKKRFEYGFDAMADSMIAKMSTVGYSINMDKIAGFKEKIRVDVKKDLMKEMDKADNTTIRWSLIGILFLFII